MTDLETLAIVWSCSHFREYLYGHVVTIYTDHLASQAVTQFKWIACSLVIENSKFRSSKDLYQVSSK